MYEIFKPYPEITIGTSTKTDGNMSFLTGDPDPEDTLYIRTAYLSTQKLDIRNLVCLNQTHGTNTAVINKSDAGSGGLQASTAIKDTDSAITNQPDIIIGILTADCLPILLYDRNNQAIGAIHAGWRGLVNNIIPNTIRKMTNHYQTDPQALIVAIGPSIGPCCYEIKDDVADQVRTSFRSNAPRIIRYTDQQKMYLDLRLAASIQLQQIGIQPEKIETSSICTKDSADLYFSYRARPNSGLNLSFIAQKHSNR